MTLTTLDDMTLAGHLERIDADGYTIVEDAIEPELVAQLRDTIRRLERELHVAPRETAAEGHATLRMYNLLAKDPVFQAMPVHPNVLPIAERLLDRGCLLSGMTAIDIGPGEQPQPMHGDDIVMARHLPLPHVPMMVTSMWALTDFTEENGATRVIPGSNHYEDKLRLSVDDSVPAEMSRGSVLVYTGAVYHGGGANRSSMVRKGVNITYNLSWLRQEENQYLACPLEIARELPVELLRLMGYQRGAYALGYVGDLQDPIEVVRPDLATRGFTASP